MSSEARLCEDPFKSYPHWYFIHFPMHENEFKGLCLSCYLKLGAFKTHRNFQLPACLGRIGHKKPYSDSKINNKAFLQASPGNL